MSVATLVLAIAGTLWPQGFEWPMAKGGPSRTGLARTAGPKTIGERPVWKVEGTTGTPILSGGKLYVRGQGGSILELDPGTGEILRKAEVGAKRDLSAAGGALLTARDREVLAIDLETFKVRWTRDTKDYISPLDVLPVGDLVFAGTFKDRTVFALDLRTGSERWRAAGPSEVCCTTLAASDRFLFVPFLQTDDGSAKNPNPHYGYYRKTRDSLLVALGLGDGKEAWRASIGTHPQGSLAVHEGRIYLTPVWTHDILCLDAATGRELWRAGPVSSQPRGGGVVVGEGRAFSAGKPGVLTGLDLGKRTPTFRFPAQKFVRYINGPPVLADGCIYFGDWGNSFYAVEIDTGKLLWKLDLGDKFTRSCVVWDGRVFFGGETGSLACYAQASGSR
jgi:outer membrane protein assembly factor BamB